MRQYENILIKLYSYEYKLDGPYTRQPVFLVRRFLQYATLGFPATVLPSTSLYKTGDFAGVACAEFKGATERGMPNPSIFSNFF